MSNKTEKEATWTATVTDAPTRYDGFGTTTVGLIAMRVVSKNDVRVIRLAVTPNEHLDWQRSRWSSGNFMAWNPGLWADIWATTFADLTEYHALRADVVAFDSEVYLASDDATASVDYILDALREERIEKCQAQQLARVTG